MDIVERLRAIDPDDTHELYCEAAILREAADEIERLRGALRHIAAYPHGGFTVEGECSGDRSDMILTARASLKNR